MSSSLSPLRPLHLCISPLRPINLCISPLRPINHCISPPRPINLCISRIECHDVNNNQTNALPHAPIPPPLVSALNTSAQQNAASFHFPGHNRGRAAPSSFTSLVGLPTFTHDLPDLPELAAPISDAQREAASLFGASQTWFLVGGSTLGIQAAIMATCSPGDALLLPRNSHLSAISAMVLSGAVPHYIVPHYDSRWDVAAGVTPLQLEIAIRELGRKPAAVLVTSPTYHGICSDLRGISRICHSQGIPLIVDEAHGAHLGFHPQIPESALQQGADLAVQSTHKVLCSLTQSSMLHISGTSLVDADRISSCLQTLQTTSPSNLLLASLDAARHQLSQDPEALFENALRTACEAKNRIASIRGISMLDPLGFPAIDPFRLTVGFSSELGLSSHQADQILYKHHGIVCELVGTTSLTFAFNLGTCEEHVERLVSGLSYVATAMNSNLRKKERHHVAAPFAGFTARLTPREAFFAKKRRVAIDNCEGAVCGELICPYPPGIPVMIPGETITGSALDYLLDVRDKGATISGASDPQLTSILVCSLDTS